MFPLHFNYHNIMTRAHFVCTVHRENSRLVDQSLLSSAVVPGQQALTKELPEYVI